MSCLGCVCVFTLGRFLSSAASQSCWELLLEDRVTELAQGHVRFRHKLHLQLRFTHLPLFSMVFQQDDLKWEDAWRTGMSVVPGRVLEWGIVQGVSLGCLLGVCSPRAQQSRAEQFAWLRYSQCSIHSDVKVLWGFWLPQASLSVQMMHKQKGKAAAGQGHQ